MGTLGRKLYTVVIVTVLCGRLALADSSAVSGRSSPDDYQEQGWKAFQQGAFDQAILSWQEAARLYDQQGKRKEHSETRLHLAQAYQSIGQYREAVKSLQVAREEAEKAEDATLLASVLGSLGNAYIATGPAADADRYLREGLSKARALRDEGLTAVILNNLGNLFIAEKKYPEATAAYQESWTLAEKTEDHALAARAMTNGVQALLHEQRYPEARARLDMALEKTNVLSHSHDKAYGLISLGLASSTLRPHFSDAATGLVQQAAHALNTAAAVAAQIGDRRAASYAWGHLGKLYEEERRYDEAMQLTSQALFAAQQANAPESLYRWQWQMGRLHKAKNDLDGAITMYRHAVAALQSLRQELSVCYGEKPPAFRESVGPLYFELVDVLLQRAASLPEGDQSEPYLRESRDTIELFKVAELQDYFGDDCVAALRATGKPPDIVSPTAAVVYPILLRDRTEVLVSLPIGPHGTLKRFTVQVTAEAFTQEVRELRRMLEKRTTGEYLPHAQQVYDWLIRPLVADLKALPIDTLVFVPDGPLRTIPMAALHDGQQFLIERYAVVTTPGLSLTDPRPLQRKQVKVLAVGVSESVEGFAPLPYVAQELDALRALYPTTALLNQEFQVSRLEQELRDQHLTIVHVASHGQFAGEAKDTFLLAHNGKVTMDRLDQLVGLFRFRDHPLELLTLSACETAAGDDRAALGLAGVAVKAGARSAVATLWSINDSASAELVTEFYRQLKETDISRAVALQRAQVKLLNQRRHQHPIYWAPFLLINNWL